MDSTTKQDKFTAGFLGLLGLLILAGLMTPRLLAYIPAVTGLLGTLSYMVICKKRPKLYPSLMLSVGAVLALAFLSSLWAIDQAEAIERCTKLSLLLLPACLLPPLMEQLADNTCPKKDRILLFVTIIGGILLMIDFTTGFPIYEFLHNLNSDTFVKGARSWLNSNVNALFLLAFPILFLYMPRSLAHLPKNTKRLTYIFVLILLAVLNIYTNSQSAQLAIVAGVIFMMAFPYNRSWAWPVLMGIISLVILIMPFFSVWAYQFWEPGTVYASGTLFDRAAIPHRMEIWYFVSKYALQSPFYGHGIEATRAVTFDSPMNFHPSNTALHPHNFAVQLWMEFGVLGALLASALACYMVKFIRNIEEYYTQRAALGCFIAWLVIAATANGLWQGWWIGLTMLLISLWVWFIHRQKALLTSIQADI